MREYNFLEVVYNVYDKFLWKTLQSSHEKISVAKSDLLLIVLF